MDNLQKKYQDLCTQLGDTEYRLEQMNKLKTDLLQELEFLNKLAMSKPTIEPAKPNE